jgi:hypothetical protein
VCSGVRGGLSHGDRFHTDGHSRLNCGVGKCSGVCGGVGARLSVGKSPNSDGNLGLGIGFRRRCRACRRFCVG